MLAKINRLAKKSDIDNLFQRGKRAFSPFFAIRYLRNSQDFCRFAVVIANKEAKKATARNRLKRQIREIIRLNMSKFSGKYDIIINISKNCLEQDYGFLEKKLTDLLRINKLMNV